MIVRPSFANGFAPRDGSPIWPELWRGCVGAWNPGLGPTGLRLYDWSPYKNHGTLTNMDAGTDWVASQGRYALDFDGANNLVVASGPSDIGTGDFTVAMWVRPTSFSVERSLFDTLEIGGNFVRNNSFVLVQNATSGTLRVFSTFGIIGYTVASSAALSLNAWNHVGLVRRSGVTSYYINGALDSVQIANLSTNLTTPWVVLGRYSDASAGHFVGQQSDIVYARRALSPNEIRLIATRPGIAYELAPRRWSAAMIEAYRRRIQQQSPILGGGIL